MRCVKSSPFNGDYNHDYTVDELIEIYIGEGKTEEEAKELALPLAKEMHRMSMAEFRSWFPNHDDEDE
jgi:hypothetical protein